MTISNIRPSGLDRPLHWNARHAWAVLLRSRFGRGLAGRFFLLWLVAKLALIVGAVRAHHPALQFSLLGECLAIGLVLFVWRATVRDRRDDRLLALLGIQAMAFGWLLCVLALAVAAFGGLVAG
ncbi:MAG TPA: hypothetical protein VFI39_09275 [Gemmatimonadales bacterium]|nr:hypothetical protein [Gemmatimonadales bacterium]